MTCNEGGVEGCNVKEDAREVHGINEGVFMAVVRVTCNGCGCGGGIAKEDERKVHGINEGVL